MKTTFAARELGTLAIALVGIPTSVTPLRSVPRVYPDDLASERFSLVLQEALELSKTPRMKSMLGFSSPSLAPSSNVLKIFDHDGGSWLNAFKDRGGQHMVAVPPDTPLASSKVSKMPLGRFRTIGLQHPPKPKNTLNGFSHMPVIIETIVRGYGWMSNANINPNSLSIRSKDNIGEHHPKMQEKSTMTIKKFCRRCILTYSILSIWGNKVRYLYSTARCGYTYSMAVPVNPKCARVKAWWAKRRSGASHFLPFYFHSDSRSNCLGSFLSSLNVQVRNQTRTGHFAISIGQMMKRIGISFAPIPSSHTHNIKRFSELPYSIMKDCGLFHRWFERKPNHSVHTNSIPYKYAIWQVLLIKVR